MTPEPYFDGQKWWYSKATRTHAQQTKERAAKVRGRADVERLRRLGVDEAWLERVMQNDDRNVAKAAEEGGAP